MEMGTSSACTPARELIVVECPDDVRREVSRARERGDKVGLVPTMGALHAGHLSLIEAARAQCDFVVVSLFVNPTQFGPNEDYNRYPRSLADDLATCREAGVNLVYHPPTETMYPHDFATFVEVECLSQVLEGKYRPGHFRGVATVVLKLFNCVFPHVAYFGRKDYQQQLLIRKMCLDLNLPVEIRTCPTIREPDGLALSSRNRSLNPDQRKSALALSQCLQIANEQLTGGETNVDAVRAAMCAHLNSTPGVNVDYATVAHPQTLEEISQPIPEMIALVAARVDEIRLIDNISIVL
jgi:pantoate--beta-alanine ligase